ncbi:MAG: hypothetical protein ACXVD4_08860 [Nocardioides sp.]
MSADEKQMKLRYAGVCRLRGAELAARAEAIYERSTKTVRCLDCSPADPELPLEPSRWSSLSGAEQSDLFGVQAKIFHV